MGRESRKRALRERNQAGATLLEAVISIAIFLAIGGSFVFAASVVFKANDQSLTATTNTISQGGLRSSFRSDINGATALKLNSVNNLLVAKSDGSCVSWTISTVSGDSTNSLFRSSAQGKAVVAGSGSVLSDGIGSGSYLALDANNASLNLNYSSGSVFNQVVPLRLSGSDGGVCW